MVNIQNLVFVWILIPTLIIPNFIHNWGQSRGNWCDEHGINQLVFRSYDYLRNHFRDQHYLCEEGDCYNEKFTSAFRSDIDLKGRRRTIFFCLDTVYFPNYLDTNNWVIIINFDLLDFIVSAHRASVHGRLMTKAAAKQARTLELEFTLKPRVRQSESRRGGGGRNSRYYATTLVTS